MAKWKKKLIVIVGIIVALVVVIVITISVLGKNEKTLRNGSFIVAKDSANVEAGHQIKAFEEAQNAIVESVNRGTILFAHAQERAKGLLEDYVNNISKSAGKKYKIEWNYIELER